MAYKQLSNGNSEGVCLGQSVTDKIGFYGLATAIIQPLATAQSAVATTTLTTITDIVTTASVTAALNAVVTRAAALTVLVNQMRTDLVALGLIKGSV
jgi:hypothetical protein